MKIPQRKAVSPIIATLLLIAIAVAAGIIVYVFVGSLSGSLTKSGGNQVTEQLSMNAYSYSITPLNLTIFVQNTGTGTIKLQSYFYDGVQVTPSGTSGPKCYDAALNSQLAPGISCSIVLSTQSAPASGTSHTVKVVTVDGGTFTFNVIAGSSG